jgi:hypothetical protein
MFSTEGQEVKQGGGLGKSLEPGVVLAHIHSASVRTAKTGKKALELVLEGPALPEPFEGWAISKDSPEGPKFKGQSARVSGSIYISDFNSDDVNKNEILSKLLVVSNELGLRKQIDNLSKDSSITSIEEWVEKAVNILKGHDLHWFLAGKEDEYNGKVIVRLSLPKFKFASADETKLNKFDKTNKWHYTPLSSKPVNGFEPVSNDFSID